MSIESWLARRLLIFGQRNQRLSVDPDLLAGWTPSWAVSQIRLIIFLAALPSAVWGAAHLLPEQIVVAIGQFTEWALWSHIKSTHYSNCTTACRDGAFELVALPLTWVAGVGGGVLWNRYLSGTLAYQRRWLDAQPDMTYARRRTIGLFRDWSSLVVVIAICTIALQAAAMWLIVGTGHKPLPFAMFCGLLTLGIAAVVGFALPFRDVPGERRPS